MALNGLLVPQDGFQGSHPLGAGDFIFSLFDEQRPKAPALTQDLIIGSLGFFHVLVEVKEYLLTVLDRRGVSFVLKPQQGPSHKAFLLIGAVLASKQGPNAYGPFVVPAGPGDDGPWDSPLAIVLLMIHCTSHSNRPREGQGKPVGSFLQTIKRDESRARHDTAMLQLRSLCLKQRPSHGLLEVTWDKGLAAIRIRHDMRLPPFPAPEGKQLPPLQLMSFSPVNEGR